ncbi:putative inner membrane domain protein, partial [Chlamydia psittaci 84-8471/1]
YASLFFWQR